MSFTPRARAVVVITVPDWPGSAGSTGSTAGIELIQTEILLRKIAQAINYLILPRNNPSVLHSARYFEASWEIQMREMV